MQANRDRQFSIRWYPAIRFMKVVLLIVCSSTSWERGQLETVKLIVGHHNPRLSVEVVSREFRFERLQVTAFPRCGENTRGYPSHTANRPTQELVLSVVAIALTLRYVPHTLNPIWRKRGQV